MKPRLRATLSSCFKHTKMQTMPAPRELPRVSPHQTRTSPGLRPVGSWFVSHVPSALSALCMCKHSRSSRQRPHTTATARVHPQPLEFEQSEHAQNVQRQLAAPHHLHHICTHFHTPFLLGELIMDRVAEQHQRAMLRVLCASRRRSRAVTRRPVSRRRRGARAPVPLG